MKSYKIAVIIPSRGLMFSRTAEEIVRNTRDINHKKFFAHGLPIPDCFEVPTQRALEDDEITHIWYVEDDMILLDNLLLALLQEDADVITCDYPADRNGRGVVFKAKDGQIVFGGLGCTLVKREIMDKMKPPYFRTDIKWRPTNLGSAVMFMASNPTSKADPEEYGKQDVNFFMKLHKVNAKISLYPITIGQRKLIKLGKAGTNNGAHQIENWTRVKKSYWKKYMDSMPVEEGSKLKTVRFKNGKTQNVSKEFAKRLVSQGKAEPLGPSAFILDTNGVDI